MLGSTLFSRWFQQARIACRWLSWRLRLSLQPECDTEANGNGNGNTNDNFNFNHELTMDPHPNPDSDSLDYQPDPVSLSLSYASKSQSASTIAQADINSNVAAHHDSNLSALPATVLFPPQSPINNSSRHVKTTNGVVDHPFNGIASTASVAASSSIDASCFVPCCFDSNRFHSMPSCCVLESDDLLDSEEGEHEEEEEEQDGNDGDDDPESDTNPGEDWKRDLLNPMVHPYQAPSPSFTFHPVALPRAPTLDCILCDSDDNHDKEDEMDIQTLGSPQSQSQSRHQFDLAFPFSSSRLASIATTPALSPTPSNLDDNSCSHSMADFSFNSRRSSWGNDKSDSCSDGHARELSMESIIQQLEQIERNDMREIDLEEIHSSAIGTKRERRPLSEIILNSSQLQYSNRLCHSHSASRCNPRVRPSRNQLPRRWKRGSASLSAGNSQAKRSSHSYIDINDGTNRGTDDTAACGSTSNTKTSISNNRSICSKMLLMKTSVSASRTRRLRRNASAPSEPFRSHSQRQSKAESQPNGFRRTSHLDTGSNVGTVSSLDDTPIVPILPLLSSVFDLSNQSTQATVEMRITTDHGSEKENAKYIPLTFKVQLQTIPLPVSPLPRSSAAPTNTAMVASIVDPSIYAIDIDSPISTFAKSNSFPFDPEPSPSLCGFQVAINQIQPLKYQLFQLIQGRASEILPDEFRDGLDTKLSPKRALEFTNLVSNSNFWSVKSGDFVAVRSDLPTLVAQLNITQRLQSMSSSPLDYSYLLSTHSIKNALYVDPSTSYHIGPGSYKFICRFASHLSRTRSGSGSGSGVANFKEDELPVFIGTVQAETSFQLE